MASGIPVVTYDEQGGDFTLNTRASRRFKFTSGTMDYATHTSSGNAWEIPITNLCGVYIAPSPGDASLSTALNVYDYTNETVAPYIPKLTATATGALTDYIKVSTTTAVGVTMTGIHFVAWGYD